MHFNTVIILTIWTAKTNSKSSKAPTIPQHFVLAWSFSYSIGNFKKADRNVRMIRVSTVTHFDKDDEHTMTGIV